MFRFQIPKRPPDVSFFESDQQTMSGGARFGIQNYIFGENDYFLGTSLKITPILFRL